MSLISSFVNVVVSLLVANRSARKPIKRAFEIENLEGRIAMDGAAPHVDIPEVPFHVVSHETGTADLASFRRFDAANGWEATTHRTTGWGGYSDRFNADGSSVQAENRHELVVDTEDRMVPENGGTHTFLVEDVDYDGTTEEVRHDANGVATTYSSTISIIEKYNDEVITLGETETFTGSYSYDLQIHEVSTYVEEFEGALWNTTRTTDIYRTETANYTYVYIDGVLESSDESGFDSHDVIDEFDRQFISEIDTTRFYVAVKGTGTNDVAVENQKNINLFRFEVFATQSEDDLMLTGIKLKADLGNVLNVKNVSLWVDTDGDSVVDTILESGINPAGGSISFDSIAGGGFITVVDTTTVYEVHGDVVSNTMPDNRLKLGFDSNVDDFISVEHVDDGRPLVGVAINAVEEGAAQIIVNTSTPSKQWVFIDQGRLTVAQDETPIRSHDLLNGTLAEVVSRIELHAQFEDIDVTDIPILVVGDGASSIDRLELYKEGDTTAFITATTGGVGSETVPTTYGGQAVKVFWANMESRQLIVKDGQDLNILIRPRMKSDNNGGISGESVQFVVLGSGNASIRARGDISSNNIPISGVDIVGIEHQTTSAEVVSITNANPDADNTNVPTGIRPVVQVKLTAATNGNSLNGTDKVVLQDLWFTIDTSNVLFDADHFRMYNKADSSVKSSSVVVYDMNGNVLHGNVSGPVRIKASMVGTAVNHSLNSGESGTFVLEADIIDTAIVDSVSSRFQGSFDTQESTWSSRDAALEAFFKGFDFPDAFVKSTRYQS